MIVVADTTPLNHPILIEQDRLLKALYGRVIIPPAVLLELQSQVTPAENQGVDQQTARMA